MADFKAKITGQLDLSKAKADIDAFLNQKRKMTIDLDFLSNGSPLSGVVKQYNLIGKQIGQQIISGFNTTNIGNQTNQLAKNIQNYTINIKQAAQQTKQFDATMRDTFDNRMTAWANNNTRAVNAYAERLQNLHAQLKKATTFQEFSQVKKDFAALQAEARATGNVGKTMGEQFTSALGSITKFAASYMSINRVFQSIKDGVNTVKELDDALVDLQKTTTATATQLNNFYKEANTVAKQYGATTREIIQSAAD